jgi:hypothetical protein
MMKSSTATIWQSLSKFTKAKLNKYSAVEPLRQEPEAPFQNATSRDWQKAFNPQRELGAFCSGVNNSALF